MKHLLQQAGQPPSVMTMIDDIVDTCSVCREWSTPLPASIASVNVSTVFNKQVEIDLLFYEKFIICHMVDRAIRWHAARVVSGKDMETLITAIDEMWVGLHGPMGELILDGETALAKGWETREYFTRKGIKPVIRVSRFPSG